jgi:hypothetical protein
MPLPGYGLVKQKKIPEALDLVLSYHTRRNRGGSGAPPTPSMLSSRTLDDAQTGGSLRFGVGTR